MRLLLAIVVVLLGRAPARAEPDSGTATLMSLGGTALPIAGLVSIPNLPRRAKQPMYVASLAALLVAPSAGQFYAGEYLSTGFKIRIGGGVVTSLGIGMLWRCSKIGTEDSDDRKRLLSCIVGGATLGAVGIATMFGGAIHDVANAGDAAPDASLKPCMFSVGARF